MSSDESLRKDITRATLKTLFRVIGFAIGLLIVFTGFGLIFGSSSTASKWTTSQVLPNHDWKMKSFSTSAPTILQIDIHGIIGLGSQLKRDEIRKLLVDSIDGDLKPGQVKALLLNIDSPGGTADDAAGICELLKEYKAKLNIPVVAYVDGLCASGGMYIACAADKIYATKSSLVGSVGVIMPTAFNVTTLMDRLGIESVTLFAGTNKDELNPFRPWKPDEEVQIQNIINSLYDQFITTVSSARTSLTKPILTEIGASIFPADQALAKGYIDEINDSYFSVLEMMATSLGVRDSYQVVQLSTGSFLEDLFGSETSALKGTIKHQLRLPGDIDPALVGKALYLYHPSGLQK